ncbi:MAG: GTPase [Acidiferrobacterales bacterium]
MPANLTPEYKAAEAAFRRARDPKERLDCLREMLRTIPKHKGTEHLQAAIKTRIKQLTEELTGPKKGGTRGGPSTVIRPEGAAQIALIGPPNAGKSVLHARLSGSNAQSGPYPFTTQFPQPGMLPCDDIYFQLIDLPPVSPEHSIPWLANALQPADACLLVVDLGDPACVDQVMALHEILTKRRVTLTDIWDEASESKDNEDELADPFGIRLPTLMIATKADQLPALHDELQVFQELTGLRYPVIVTSATTGEGLDEIAPWLFRSLGIVRVYTKAPGRPPDKDKPFTVRRGQTVHDVAVLVHKEIAQSLKYARLWRGSAFDGQQVGRDHPVVDADIIELHG